MNSKESLHIKRKNKILSDLESLKFNFPKGVRERLEKSIDEMTNSNALNPISFSNKLFNLAPNCKRKAYLSVVLSILGELAIFATYFFGAFTAQGIINVYKGKGNYPIYEYSLFALFSIAIYFIFTGLSSYLSHTTAFHLLDNLRKAEFQKLQKISSGYLVEQPVGKIKVFLHEKVQNLEDWVAHVYPELPGKIIHPIFSVLILFSLDWRIGISIFAPLPLLIIGYLIMMNKYEARVAVFMSSYSYLSEKTVEFVKGIPVIKAFLQEDKTFYKYKKAAEFYHDTTLDWYKKTWLSMSIVMGAIMTPLLLTLPLAFYLYYTFEIQIWELLLSIILPLTVLPQAFTLGQFMELFQISKESASEIFDFFDLQEQIRPDDLKIPFNPKEGIEFKNVSFSYYKGLNVLHDISFRAEQDEVTAIVGPSGSGKSTIAKLIAGLWDQDNGEILIEGVENTKIPFDKLMEEISYVSQDNFLFNTTINENLLIAKPNSTDGEIINACKLASCHDFIIHLPSSYDTVVGECGNNLSGGERQRITIARAILKNSKIIILDEATAYTDPENESIIQNAISKLVKNKTLIVIAHRLNTIVNADKIIVVNEGKIDDCGTHAELLKSSEVYRRLWEQYKGE